MSRIIRQRYVWVSAPGNARANKQGYVFEHLLVAERALGRPIRLPEVVHHVNEDKNDNRPENLVICENEAYHHLLHLRLFVLKAGGDPNTEKFCRDCSALKPKSEFGIHRGKVDGLNHRCRSCVRKENALVVAKYKSLHREEVRTRRRERRRCRLH